MTLTIVMEGKIVPDKFENIFMALFHKVYAPLHFKALGKEFEATMREVEDLITTELHTRRVQMEGRRGRPAPIRTERIYDLYNWEVIHDGSQWIFRMGSNSSEQGKELRRMEYSRQTQYKALKTDAPVRPGRPRNEDYEVITGGRAIGTGPIRYAKHIHLESWEWDVSDGGSSTGKFKRGNMAPFKARCAQIFQDTIKHMSKVRRGRTS